MTASTSSGSGAPADVLIDTRRPEYLADRDLGYERLSRENPGLIYLRISPFGDDGPWASYAAATSSTWRSVA